MYANFALLWRKKTDEDLFVTDQTKCGRDPCLHGALYLFFVTHATEDGVGAGTVNTLRMIEGLGRAETIPQVTKLRRIEQVKKAGPPRPRLDGPNDYCAR